MDSEKNTNEREREATKKPDNLSIPIAIVFAGLLIGGAIIFTDKTNPSQVAIDQIPTAQNQEGADTQSIPEEFLAIKNDDHVLGNPNADVVLIEYSDSECPYCKRFHETMVQVMEEYGQSGQVAWVYRHFPLDTLHPKARKEGEAQECASEQGGNDMFWKFTDKLFEITPSNNGLDPAQLPAIASIIGLDIAKFTSCLNSGKYAERVDRDFVEGANIGVKSTPYSIVWNRKTGRQFPMNGAYPYENVMSILGLAIAPPVAVPQ